MEFISRGGDRRTQAPATTTTTSTHAAAHGGRRKHIDWAARTVRLELFILLVGSALILAALSLWLATGDFKSGESEHLDTKRYQAVFLTNNQVYFGKITDLGGKAIVLSDVFYIETPNQGQSGTPDANSNYTLRKLGTNELHAPDDRMVINREQVVFWENLKDSGQVVTKIKEYKQNPDAAQPSGNTNQNNSAGQNQQNTPTQNPAQPDQSNP